MSNSIAQYNPDDHEPLPEGEEQQPRFTATMGLVRWILLGGMSLFAVVMVLNYFGLTPWSDHSTQLVRYHCPMHPTYVSSQPGDCPICGMSLVQIDTSGTEVPQARKDTTVIQSSSVAVSPEDAGPEKCTCPMHPQAASDTMGKCPKCGMNLESDTATAKQGQYTCPMHPEVVSETMGKCPKCGMNLESDTATAKPVQYTCPMHPEVVSDTMGVCPKCGMNLEKVESSKKTIDHHGSSINSDSTVRAQLNGQEMGSFPVPGLVPITLEPKRLQLIGVRIGTVGMRNIDGGLRLAGYVTPDETRISTVHVRFSGWVKRLGVNQTGQQVQASDMLLSVFSEELYQAEQEYIQARNSSSRVVDPEASNAKTQLFSASRKRLELLGIPPQELAILDTAHAPNQELWVRSPFSGYVLEKGVSEGQFIEPSQTLFTIADLRTVWILADVYETDLSNIRLDQPARFKSAAYPEENLKGRVSFIYPAVAEQTRTLKIRIELGNESQRLKPGMYGEVEIVGGNGKQVLAVASDAVMDDGDRQYAFVIHNGTHFEPRLLTTGKRSGDFIEIIAGLADGEQVVTSANFLIDSESRLKAAIAGMGSAEPSVHAGHGK